MQAYNALQRKYDNALPPDFDGSQSDIIETLDTIELAKIIADKLYLIDSNTVSKAVKACQLEIDTLFNAVSFEILNIKNGD